MASVIPVVVPRKAFVHSVFPAPNPRENTFSNDIDTLQSSINRHPVRIDAVTPNRILYLGGSNASDTKDLWQGRGASPEMPFASFLAVINYITGLCDMSNYTTIVKLLSDITINSHINLVIHGSGLSLQSADTSNIKTISAASGVCNLGVIFGRLSLSNVGFSNLQLISYTNLSELFIGGNINTGGNLGASQDLFSCNYGGRIRTETTATVNVSGSGESVIYCGHGASAVLSCSFTGSFTGKKFRLLSDGTLDTYGRGVNFLPGTVAGTSDAHSKYF